MELVIQSAQLALAVLGALLLAWAHWLERRGRAATWRRFRTGSLATLGILGLAAYLNFGRLHGGNFIHTWDTYHYYIGAKYFPELGYERLYECTALADVESGRRHDVATRTMTDLRSNEQVKSFAILAHPETCTSQFSAERWAAFTDDVAWFRARVSATTWRRSQRDHGYNATPVWTALGYRLANLAPASDLQITCLALLDCLLLIIGFLLIVRSFGWRVAAVALVMLGTLYPSRFYWTGGAFLRSDWLFWMIAGLCALRRQRPFLGGAALAYAGLLRVFPWLLFAGPVIAALDQLRRTRTWNPSHLRMFAGAAVAVALTVPAAFTISGDGGRDISHGFVANTLKHADTPLTNHMGLPTVLAYDPDTTVRQLAQTRGDVWHRFMAIHRDAARDQRPVILAAAALCLGLLWLAARHPLWRVTALSLVLVPVLLQLTCYYYVFAIAWAVLAERRPRIGAVLLAMCAATMALGLTVMPRVGGDEGYTVQSIVVLIGMAGALGLALRGGSGSSGRPGEPGRDLLADGERAGEPGALDPE